MSRWKGIVVHHSASHDSEDADVRAIDQWHRARGWSRIGYHFVCEKVGAGYLFLAGRPAYMTGSHAKGHNSDHLGVVLVGNFEEYRLTDAQLEVAVEGIAGLCAMNGIGPDRIRRHGEMEGAQTLCPGQLVRFDELVERVRAILLA